MFFLCNVYVLTKLIAKAISFPDKFLGNPIYLLFTSNGGKDQRKFRFLFRSLSLSVNGLLTVESDLTLNWNEFVESLYCIYTD